MHILCSIIHFPCLQNNLFNYLKKIFYSIVMYKFNQVIPEYFQQVHSIWAGNLWTGKLKTPGPVWNKINKE